MLSEKYIDEMDGITVSEERRASLLVAMDRLEHRLNEKDQRPGTKTEAGAQRPGARIEAGTQRPGARRGKPPRRGLAAFAVAGISVAACVLFAIFALPALTPAPDQGAPPFETGPQPPGQPNGFTEPKPYAVPETCSQKLCSVAWQVDDCIYYACGMEGIFRINNDGTGHEKVNGDYALSLQADGDWLYYECADEGLVKTRFDGSDRTILLAGVNVLWMAVDEGWIYCLVFDWANFSIMYHLGEDPAAEDFYSLVKVRTDGGETAPLLHGLVETPLLLDGWIYYLDSDGNIARIDEDGGEEAMVCDNAADAGSMSVDRYGLTMDGGYIYYVEQVYNKGDTEKDGFAKEIISTTLCRIKPDGTDQSEITEADFQSDFAVEDGWVYYATTNIDELNDISNSGYEGDLGKYAKGLLYKASCDGTQKEKLFEAQGSLFVPIVAGDWVYFRISNVGADDSGNIVYFYSDKNDINLYRVKKDGTGIEKVNLYGSGG